MAALLTLPPPHALLHRPQLQSESPHTKSLPLSRSPSLLAELLCWALDRPITHEQAMTTARRQQGRSWEIVESAVRDLGAGLLNL